MSIILSIIMMKLMVADTAMCVCVRVCVCVEDGDDHHHDDSVTSCSSKFVGELNHTKLNMYIERLIGDVQQAKDLFARQDRRLDGGGCGGRWGGRGGGQGLRGTGRQERWRRGDARRDEPPERCAAHGSRDRRTPGRREDPPGRGPPAGPEAYGAPVRRRSAAAG